MSIHRVSHTEIADRGRYWTETPAGEAELTYAIHPDKNMVISSTFVPREARGAGIALALVRRAVEDARLKGRKVTPVCPYVDRVFARHPEWFDLLA